MLEARSLARRLVLGAAILLALGLGLGGVLLAATFRDTAQAAFQRRLDAHLDTLISAMEVVDGRVRVNRPPGDPRFEQVFSGWYWQISMTPDKDLRSRSLWDRTLPSHPAGGERQTRVQHGFRDQRLLVVEQDIQLPDSDVPLHVIVAADMAEVIEDAKAFNRLLAISLSALGLLLVAGVALQVKVGLRPLGQLAGDLAALRAGRAERLGDSYPAEVMPLVQAMNSVLDHDAALLDRARTHVGNLAHALKTPLAVLKGELGSDPRAGKPIAEMSELVERHLARAHAEASSGRALGHRLPVIPVADELAGMFRKVYADKALELSATVGKDAVFPGDRGDLTELLGNLLDNACKWCRHAVALTVRMDADDLLIEVADDGPGLTDEQAAQAVQRGKRLDERTPGSGLGLSIVSDLLTLYGGEMTFGRPALGGLQVTLRIPLSKQPVRTA